MLKFVVWPRVRFSWGPCQRHSWGGGVRMNVPGRQVCKILCERCQWKQHMYHIAPFLQNHVRDMHDASETPLPPCLYLNYSKILATPLILVLDDIEWACIVHITLQFVSHGSIVVMLWMIWYGMVWNDSVSYQITWYGVLCFCDFVRC